MGRMIVRLFAAFAFLDAEPIGQIVQVNEAFEFVN
jgi:hypothetical protein